MTVGGQLDAAGRRRLQWVVERLESWGAWANSGGGRNGYGESCLTLEEIRSMPVRSYIPMSPPECEQLHEALWRLPTELRRLAWAWYVHELTKPQIGRRMRVSERHVWRLHETLLIGLEYCFKNHGDTPCPLHLLLKS